MTDEFLFVARIRGSNVRAIKGAVGGLDCLVLVEQRTLEDKMVFFRAVFEHVDGMEDHGLFEVDAKDILSPLIQFSRFWGPESGLGPSLMRRFGEATTQGKAEAP